MGSLDVKAFANIVDLGKAFVKDKQIWPRGTPPLPGPISQFFLAGPALTAAWIQHFAPALLEKKSIRVVVVSPRDPASFEYVHAGCWYSILPHLLGRPELDIQVRVLTKDPDGLENSTGALFLPMPAAQSSATPLHAYLEHQPDGPVDLLVLHDLDLLMSTVGDWADELLKAANAGMRVAGVAANADEYELLSGLLELEGFDVLGQCIGNRFAPTELPIMPSWGAVMWQVNATERRHGGPSNMELEEAQGLMEFVQSFCAQEKRYPPLQQYGRLLSGTDSPATNGASQIQLPESLYFDPKGERFSILENGLLVSVKALDDFAKSSALLASYDGRTTRFHQILWAVRVFRQCASLLGARTESPGPLRNDDEPCPECGEIHNAADGMTDFLSHVLEDESPKTKLRAALQLALHIVETEVAQDEREDSADADAADNLDDLAIYETLLSREYLNAAFSMALDGDPELLNLGENPEGYPLVMLVVFSGEFELLEKMLEVGEGLSATADDGSSVFHAVALSDAEVPTGLLMSLAEYGVSPNVPDDEGTYPLEAAVYEANWANVANLLDVGAAVGATGLDAHTLAEELRANGFSKAAEALKPKRTPRKLSAVPRAKKQKALPPSDTPSWSPDV
jgi:hypothetical protein